MSESRGRKRKKKTKTTTRKRKSKGKAATAAAPSSPRTSKEDKSSSGEAPRPRPTPTGPAPAAMVQSRHRDSMHEREARGFSRGELEAADVPSVTAHRLGLLLDLRRRSVVDRNVEALQEWYGEGTARRHDEKGAPAVRSPKRKKEQEKA